MPGLIAVLLAVALAAGLAACRGGDSGDDARERVEGYVERAGAIERRHAADFERANQAYVAYSRGELGKSRAATDVAAAERAIRAGREELGGLRPPADARALHARLLRYFDMNVGLAAETTQLARYVPRATRALAPLDGVNGRLTRRLDAATGPDEQAAALGRFTAALDSLLGDLRALEVPPVLRPAHGDQVRRLDATRSLARRLRAALLAQDAPEVARLLVRFRESASARKPRRTLAARAVARYNRRLRALNDAHSAVLREHVRLDRRLP